MKWNLDNIYKSFDSKEYINDFKNLNNNIENLKQFINSDLWESSDEEFMPFFEDVILKYEEIENFYNKMQCFIFLKLSCNSSDKLAIDMELKLRDLHVNVVLIEANLIKNLSKRKEEIDFSKSSVLKEYEFFIKEMLSEGKHLLSDEVEETMASLYNYGAYSFSTLQEALVSKYKVSIEKDGEIKEIPLTECRSLLDNDCSEIRIKAIEAEKRLYRFMEEPIAFALNNIKKSVIYDTKKRGYKSPLSRSLKQNRISEEIFDALIGAIEESLPFFREFLKLKAKLMGNENGRIPFRDLFASTLKTNKKVDFQFAQKFLIENFYSFSKEFGEFVENAFKNNWIDSEIYEGKVGGAFCDFISDINESRILLNFSNSYDSVFTLAHELGHAYHGETLKNERIFNKHYPMVIAETASIFSETLICDKAYSIGDETEKIIILEYELNSAAQTIVDIYSRFLFEKEVFDRCENEFLTPKDLNKIMKNAQKATYGDAMDEEYFEQAWIYKSHYYMVNNNFYNYPYAFGHLFSLGLYNIYLNNPNDFNSKYNLILRNSGKKNLKEIGEMCSLDLNKKQFFLNSINILKSKFLKYKELVSKM